MKAEQLRARFNNMFGLKDEVDGPKLHGFPPRTRDELTLSELYCIVGDIIIWIEEKEKDLPSILIPEDRK